MKLLNKHSFYLSVTICAVALSACTAPKVANKEGRSLSVSAEKRISNITQLTFGGTNAEAYWSYDGEWLIFQRKPQVQAQVHDHSDCDQIYRMRPDGSGLERISTGLGRTTCSFYFPDNARVLYSSTFASDSKCPPPPDMSRGYVWPVYPTFQMYSARPDGSDLIPMEPAAARAYNAEAVTCADSSVIFTSDRDGDLELYRATLDPQGTMTNIKRITNTPGYDGGAFFSQDCKKIVWRASRPQPGKEMSDYAALLREHKVRPTRLEIWMANADGTHAHQVTQTGAASFAPYFSPDGQHIVFSSNSRTPNGRKFDLHIVNTNGTRLEQVTFSDTFDSFPMFSPDGKRLAFSSNRNATQPRETNVFVADWVNLKDRELSVDDSLPADRVMATIETLSSPEMEGRGITTDGIKLAENFLEARFKALGLKPLSGLNSFRHSIEMNPSKKAGAGTVAGNNIVGTLGDDCRKTRPVVIGAHFDHLGFGSHTSLEVDPDFKKIHPGADDNSSGVAALLEVAKLLKDAQPRQAGCLIFAAFTGEEIGVAGSSRFIELLKSLQIRPKAMLNMDMVGKLENNSLVAFGTETAIQLPKLLETECSIRSLACAGGGDGYGASDHMPFFLAGVPVLHFFTGAHEDHHRSTDVSSKINATGIVQISELVAAVATRIGDKRQRLDFKKTANPHSGTMLGQSGRRNQSGAYLGTIPDYGSLTAAPTKIGIKLAGARPGSPAEVAGILAGDILVAVTEYSDVTNPKTMRHETNTLDEFMAILGVLKPGQQISLIVMREGAKHDLQTTVGKRETQ